MCNVHEWDSKILQQDFPEQDCMVLDYANIFRSMGLCRHTSNRSTVSGIDSNTTLVVGKLYTYTSVLF